MVTNLKNIHEHLTSLCVRNYPIDKGYSLVPGVWMNGQEEGCEVVDAEFGVRRLCKEGKKPLVRLGFDIDLAQNLAIVRHTPQGLLPEHVCCRNQQRFYSHDFRREALETLCEFLLMMGVESVIGISAQNNYKIKAGVMSWSEGVRIFDDVFKRSGFSRMTNGNFIRK